jgi:glycerophosphoryl diester phosphodiesterase
MHATVNGWLSSLPIAHRGLHDAQLPENSLPAFDMAAVKGYGIELDIHLTRDGQLAVFHDDNTLRMTGRGMAVRDSDSAQLSELRLKGTSYGIPLLRDVFQAVAGRVPILIEVKAGSAPEKISPVLVTELARYEGTVAVQSFDPRIVLWFKRNAPNIVRGQLGSSFKKKRMSVAERLLVRSMLSNLATRPQFIAFDVNDVPNVAVELWRRVLRAELLLWTVRTPEQAQTATRLGAGMIFESIVPALHN